MLMSSLAKARVATSDSQNVTINKAPGDKRYCAGLESPLTTLPGSWHNIPHFHQQPVCCEILSYRQLSCGATQLDRCNSGQHLAAICRGRWNLWIPPFMYGTMALQVARTTHYLARIDSYRASWTWANFNRAARTTFDSLANWLRSKRSVRMPFVYIVCILAFLFAVPTAGQESDDLKFASGLEQFQDIRRMLPSYLNNIGLQMLTQRQRQIEGLATIEDVSRRKAYLRERMLNDLGGFPERTPLNARLVGVLQRPRYRIEKVIFESQPHFYVTANLYLPTTGHPPYPAILFPLGHEPGGKTNPTWQQMLGSLATKGFVALTWDPIGQGERLQIYDEDLRESKVGDSTTEHTVVGAQCLLIGDHLARYTIWDGMRALDYLLSRPEVDPTRVGLTGNSGGGTHTAYIAALDDRIQVAAPSCYITSWRRMLQTIGPQDAEQTFPFWLQDGLDYPDYLYAFAPKPYLLLSAIGDFFPIEGARETFAEAAKVYSAIGAKEKLGMFEADDGHGYNKTRRLAAYDWFGRWLKGAGDTDPEPQIEMATPEELRCTPTG